MSDDPTTLSVQDGEELRLGTMIRIDVGTQGGQVLLDLIEAKLAERLEALAAADGICQGYLDVLQTINYHVRMAAGKSAKVLRRRELEGTRDALHDAEDPFR